MKHLAPACFRAFACAAGSCPDSCCRAGWEIIPDEKSLALYQALPGEAGARIRAGIVPPVGAAIGRPPEAAASDELPPLPAEPLLRQDPNRVCVLLDPDGLCCVQKHFGHGALCRVCREYPRFHREFGGLTEHGLSLSCPTAYALATAAPPVWEEWEDEAPPVPNELDPEAYLRLRKGRALALELLAKEDVPFWRRIALVRRLAAAMQAAPERRIRHNYELRLRRWTSLPPSRRDRPCLSARGRLYRFACGKLHSCRMPDKQGLSLHPEHEGAVDCGALARRFLELEILSPAWRDALERFLALAETERTAECCSCTAAGRTAECRPCTAEGRTAAERTAECRPYTAAGRTAAGRTAECRPYTAEGQTAECRPYTAEGQARNERPDRDCLTPPDPEPYARWLWYALYKYWMDALDDGRLLPRVDRSLAMLLLGLSMDRALPGEGPFLRRISREIEHCEENLAALLEDCANPCRDFAT